MISQPCNRDSERLGGWCQDGYAWIDSNRNAYYEKLHQNTCETQSTFMS